VTKSTKLELNPRITDQQLTDLIKASPNLTAAFGERSVADFCIEDNQPNDAELELYEALVASFQKIVLK